MQGFEKINAVCDGPSNSCDAGKMPTGLKPLRRLRSLSRSRLRWLISSSGLPVRRGMR